MIKFESGLYKVRIERMNMLFDDLQPAVVHVEIKYIFVNDYDTFKKWLTNLYKDYDIGGIEYEKISETVEILN